MTMLVFVHAALLRSDRVRDHGDGKDALVR